MPPLTRQETRTSVFSWWSDRNPLLKGPTINLHAVAKPLMKFMYHRQALDFIRKNEDSPISATTLEIYASYFPYVAFSLILHELLDGSDVAVGGTMFRGGQRPLFCWSWQKEGPHLRLMRKR
jgi:hypothetical protein